MFGALLWTLRQRRYRALWALMVVIALACIGLGTFEIHRLAEKRHDNGALVTNAHAATAPLTTSLVPLVGAGPAPGSVAIRLRTVSVSGAFLTGEEQYVANAIQDGREGFTVLTPLRSAAGVVLVVRGFVAASADGSRPAVVPAPPAGPVTVAGRLQNAQTASDQAGALGRGEIMSVNPRQQAERLGGPVFDAYLTLERRQPATAGLAPIPGPDLSNPTGGAGELQLLSYVIQWYIFALLALSAPLLFARAEVREARRRYLGIDPDAVEFGELEAAPASSGSELEVRARGTELARRAASARIERASRLADRYGQSLGPDLTPDHVLQATRRETAPTRVVRDSAATPHRSADEYHGAYNDYLWELALGDGDLPDVLPVDDSGPRPSADDIDPQPIRRDRPGADDSR